MRRRLEQSTLVSLARRQPQGLLLVLVLLAALGVVLGSERGSAWLTERLAVPTAPPAVADPPMPQVDWPAVGAAANSYLQAYLRFDTSQPAGAEQAARWLQRMLQDAGIESRLVPGAGSGLSVIGRLAGQGVARPLILYSRIEAPPADPTRWSVPPFEGALREGYLYGAGAVDPKGQTIANLATMLLLSRLAEPLERDVVFLAVNGEPAFAQPGAPLLAELDRLQPEWLLGAGGGSVELQPGERAWLISTFSKGYLNLRVGPAQVDLSAAGAPAGTPAEQLAWAVNRMLAWQAPIAPSPTTNEFFRRLAGQYPSPVRAILVQPVVWSRLVAPRLLQNPAAADRLRDTVSLVRLEPWPDDPLRPSAVLQVRTMPGEARNWVLAELRSAAGVAGLRFQLLEEVGGEESPWDTSLFQACEAAARREDPQMLVLPTGGGIDSSRYFRSRGVVCYGFLPFDLDSTEIQRIGRADERLSAQNLQLGVRRTVEIVLAACARP